MEFAVRNEPRAVFPDHPLIGFAVFLPRVVPALRRLRSQPRIDLLGIIDGKIVGQLVRRAMERHPALVHHEDGIIQLQMRQRVRHREHDPAVLARQVMQQAHDFPLRARVESGRHLVAQQQLGIGNQLHRQPEPTLLPAGKNLHLPVADRAQAGFLEHLVDPVVELPGIAAADAQAGGGLHRLIHRQRIISD